MHLAPRATTAAVLLLVAMGGCGGESVNSGDDAEAGESGEGQGGSAASGSGGKASGGKASGGASGSAGSAQAGTSSGRGSAGGSGGTSAGTAGVAGRSSVGGTVSIGGSAGSAGSARAGEGGAGGEPEDICRKPAETGSCAAAFERWYFNAERGICERFIYGGCEANENNFTTPEACLAECGGHGLTDPTACDSPTDCVVTATHCCGGGSPPTLADVTAVSAASLDEFGLPCQLVDCTSTVYPIPAYFGATCSSGHCLAFDIRNTELTRCEESEECRLRDGLHCCEGCSSVATNFVAIRGDANLGPLACGTQPIGCDPCVSQPPDDLRAECVAGNCEVVSSLAR